VEATTNSVAVVGGGCAGPVAALRLAEAGVPVVLLDKSAAPGVESACGGVMLHALRRRLDLPDDLVDGEVDTLEIVARGRRDRLRFSTPVFVNFDRCRFDAHLAARAAAAGAELRSGCRVTAWDPADGRLEWVCDGHRQQQRFGIVVFADGARTVARARGLGLADDVPMASAFYRELEDDSGRTDETEFHLDLPDDDPGYFWVFPKRGVVQVGVGRLHGVRKRPLRELLDGFIARDPRLAGLPRRLARGGSIPFATARRFAHAGGLVVGDAAGLVNPITGGGLVYAIASAEMAARAIADGAARGWKPARIGRVYQRRLRRSIHYWWLLALGVPFRFYHRRVERGRTTFFKTLFLAYARVLPSLTPAAKVVTLAMRDAGRAGSSAG
jgi:geranylgeranyl reductase family protein